MRDELPFQEKVLQTLHNLGVTTADSAKTSAEIAVFMQKDQNQIESILDKYKDEGFIESFVEAEEKNRYYLNAKGIIKVCSLFT